MSIVIFKGKNFDTRKLVKVTMNDDNEKVYYGKLVLTEDAEKMNISKGSGDISVPAYKSDNFHLIVWDVRATDRYEFITEDIADIENFEV
ncbi:hypothetical protein HMPREF0765_1116 [Sphingobacterium spiritivorum ATCC 33300]|uniref:Uncharacterized protein n=1 Tax=Sphingobacterium spiritivorum ATCC 33300 TaxID=525372 RepID=C2FUW0_SPHSI|nr:hypothetical protein [Sphingobacterium spiritivorum]EEI93314.1 hypothetical protein HMPREF0765_1116 [Sphingobacterium spiritivorum ATCC 33300]QQS96011.1 hypothetical protein I6J03_22005 [Sphingobacterium spiritivorum]